MDDLGKQSPLMSVYADTHHIFYLVQNMVSSLLLDQPDDPITHLIHLLKTTNMDIPRILVLGPPAVGKTTVARRLSTDLGVAHVTSDSLRNDQSELSERACHHTVPQQDNGVELTVRRVLQRLNHVDCLTRGWVLDGISQTRQQALALQQAGVIPLHVVMLDAPDDMLLERSRGRLVDPVTSDIYHQTFIWPADDAVAERLEKQESPHTQHLAELHQYRSEVTGLSSAYQHVLKAVSADQPHADVYQQVLASVQTFPGFRIHRILLLGPPRSGKSHQARLLSDKYKMVDISCDQLLRSAASDGSGLGENVQLYLDDGQPVPDILMLRLLEERLSQADCRSRGWVLHGFPLDLRESQYQPTSVVFLELSDDLCLERATLRATDPVTGERFHGVNRPAPSSEVQNRLQTRPEDHPDSVTQSLIQYKTARTTLQSVYPDAIHIDGDQDPVSVFEALEIRLMSCSSVARSSERNKQQHL
ncbi:adenylate kinase 8 [Thalassophryne amazonica]|uniref:adenylate kinase 8 n=1 Tax=Thalassophryne amazonica TaxID=390379 RepID=UPI0014713D81|nr:adenylate kinase 8 [Thalassophryne amazonica]